MAHPFEVRKEIEVAATPEQVWEAIATGPGIDGWFVGAPNEVEPGVGGRVRLSFGGETGELTITTWEPPHRFVHQGEPGPDGAVHAMEYVIEGRAGGRTLVRLVHSGFLGDDWEAEYEALGEGDFMYLQLLAEYLEHFRGRPAKVVSLWRPDTTGRERALATLRGALGLGDVVSEGDTVRFSPSGLPSIEGVVDFVSPSIIGLRSDDALYQFLHSPQGVVYLGHHLYRADLDKAATEQAWRAWLERTFS